MKIANALRLSRGRSLGGSDPYSSARPPRKLHRRVASFLFQNHPVKIASARAGNVIGGGDWAADRIVPDCIRALQRETHWRPQSAFHAPVQHVLEPLSGLPLACRPSPSTININHQLCSAFNFGRRTSQPHGRRIGRGSFEHWPGRWKIHPTPARA